MNTLIMAGQMILALSILVSLHELGHYLAARAFGIKVEKFYLFFDAWGIKLFSFKKGDTEYGIGWLPLGGYVKIAGMIDESLDTDQLKSEPKDYEFRSKPAWQRLIVMLAGVTVNIVLGICIYGLSIFYYGDSYLPASEVKYGISTSEYARSIGFQDGDQVLRINGHTIEKFDEILSPGALMSKNAVYTVERDGNIIDIQLPDDFLNELSMHKKQNFLFYRYKYSVKQVMKGSSAEKAGLLAGDHILSVNDTPAVFFHDFKEMMLLHKGENVMINVLRGTDTLPLVCAVDADATIGFEAEALPLNIATEHYSLATSMSLGTQRAFEALSDNVKALGKLFTGEVDPTKSLMGPIRLATVFGAQWIWQKFWALTGLLSMILAFMNVLPIPALDGGHALFLTIEMIIGRPLGDRFMQVTQVIGMVILLSLMIFVFGNDIWNLLP
jgi:regulator of sigma E protease